MSESREMLWVELDELDEVRKIAAAEGVEVQEHQVRGFEPITSTLLIIIGAAAAVGVVMQAIEVYRGGQVIDLRKDALKPIYRSRDLVYGLVVILTNDGKVDIEVKEPKGLFGQVIDTIKNILVDLGKESIDKTAELVEEALKGFGTDVSVTTTTATDTTGTRLRALL